MGNLRLAAHLVLAVLLAAGAADEEPPPADRAPTAAAPSASEPEAPLSPEDEGRSFVVAPGFEVELVAAEPLVESPVSIAFDPDGRLWVVEMPGFMPNLEGTGEEAPTGRVVVLKDSDGDGRMDTRTVFLDRLVLPRSVAFTAGGVLIAAPPELIFCRDADRDDRCDAPEVVVPNYGTGRNPEHDANGLVLALDNWLYSANLGARHRFVGGAWKTEPTVSRGQWGIAQDDFGRLFYNTNSVYVRADALPVFAADAHVRGTRGLNLEIDHDQSTWPARPNTGVNRGYRSGTLRADRTLAEFTAACGPHVYRGDLFPETFRGNVFVAEPAANFVRRSVVTETPDGLTARNAYDKSEFLSSKDERFRPVNLATGPDGALYVVDMYRGLIQHRIYLTSYLREQARKRGLDRPVDRGRIWRVVSAGASRRPSPTLARATSDVLVAYLVHANGWWRDTAQRLLVERGDKTVVPALQELLQDAPDPRTRLHALFVLDGLDVMDPPAIDRAARDGDRFVRLAAAGLLEREKLAALAGLAAELGVTPRLDPATLAGVAGRELDLLARMLVEPSWRNESLPRAALLRKLAVSVIGERRAERTVRLLEMTAAEPSGGEWRQAAILSGVLEASQKRRPLLDTVPEGWARLTGSSAEAVRRLAASLDPWVTGREARAPKARSVKALNAAEALRFTRGKAQFAGICGACHHPSGIGEEGKAPPLVGSPWATGPAERLARIALHGMRGPVRVGRRVYRMEMPPMGALDDNELADLLTYIRNEQDWGHGAGAIDAETVARVRKATAARKEPWTADELLAVR